MTRYSRSVIPGRPSEEGRSEAEDGDNLDRIVFGSKKKPIMPPANDREDYPDPMDMDVDEAGFLVDRSTKDRRGGGERRAKADRRRTEARRTADYVPLRENGAPYRGGDASGRGPILLVGALVIVAVFGVVVWNAYREGVRTDDPEATPQLATSGSFKTPPRDVTPTAAAAAPADVLEQLEGGPAPVADTPPEVRPEPVVVAPVQAAVAPAPAPTTPAPSKFTAPPPAPLKQPVTVAAAPAPTVAAAPAKPSLDIPKPTAAPPATAPAPTVVAAAPVAAPVAAAPAGAFKPAFSAGGKWLVQVAAPSTEAGASAEWDKRVKALPEFFAAAERVVVQADVNGKTVYRLRAGAFASKADADAFCSAYKAKGGNCFPATR